MLLETENLREYNELLVKLRVNKIDEFGNQSIQLIRKMGSDELNTATIVTLQRWDVLLENIFYSFLDEIFNCGAHPDSILNYSGRIPIGGDEKEDIRLIKFFIRRGAKTKTLKHLIELMGN